MKRHSVLWRSTPKHVDVEIATCYFVFLVGVARLFVYKVPKELEASDQVGSPVAMHKKDLRHSDPTIRTSGADHYGCESRNKGHC